jgi:HD-like signal output (HDOD) protein
LTSTQPAITQESIRALQELVNKTGDLPPLPRTTMAALHLMDRPGVSAKELQSVIGQDQALAARILKIVNSAMYCFEKEVSTLSHAIAILGMTTVRSILVAASVEQVFPAGTAGRDLTTKLFWDHSWGAALAGKSIAVRVKYPVPEEAFTAGLVHDLGKMVLLTNHGSRYREILNDVYRRTATFCEAEFDAFGFTHAQIGAVLAQKWHFPNQLIEAILHHHTSQVSPTHGELAAIVALADRMMAMLEIGFCKDKSLKLEEEASARQLKLAAPVLKQTTADVQGMILTMSGQPRM